MLKLAGLLLNLGLAVHSQTVGEQSFRQPMPTDDIRRSLASAVCELNNHTAIANRNPIRFKRVMAWVYKRFVMMWFRWMRLGTHQSERCHLFNRQAHRQGSMDFHVLKLGDLSVLLQRPKLFQDLIELFFIGHGKDFLRRNLAVMQFNPPVRQSGHNRVMRDHDNGPPLLMQVPQKLKHDFLVLGVEISRRLIRQNNLGIVNQGPGDANPLLLTAR
jgi:hypothetical protein